MKLGESIWYCKKKENDVDEFEYPVEIILQFNNFTLMPTTGYTNIMIYGKDIKRRYTGIANQYIWGDTFHEGDRFYVDGLKPAKDEENGSRANAEIDGILYDNHSIILKIKKLVANGN